MGDAWVIHMRMWCESEGFWNLPEMPVLSKDKSVNLTSPPIEGGIVPGNECVLGFGTSIVSILRLTQKLYYPLTMHG